MSPRIDSIESIPKNNEENSILRSSNGGNEMFGALYEL
jgi:hypothetical protein